MRYSTSQNQQGFTLVELLVTISIIVLVTGLALARYSAFNSTILLNNEAYEVALDIRRAQAYGLSASGYGSGDFRSPYGISFDLGQPGQYIFFQDSSGNNRYNSSPDEALEIIDIDSRFVISKICRGTTCRTSGSDDVAVTFERPNFVAKFGSSFSSSAKSMTVTLTEANGTSPASKVILVESTGYISVQ